jgi:hypothetical protein
MEATKTKPPRKKSKAGKPAAALPNNEKKCPRVSFPMPKSWVPLIKKAAASLDLDKSKLIRSALREKLKSMGMEVPEMPFN